NYASQPPEGCDTVGALATDGSAFAAAASTGGLSIALQGRVSDVALPGGGLYAGPEGAVALTGQGDYIGRHVLAYRAYDLLARGASAEQVTEAVLAVVPAEIPLGILALTQAGLSAKSNRPMPWASVRSP
ncbi:MAG TPA: isoaspartyl peptidase/L-asparaginase, partial [Candidatus Thermoplasmatota archaeon]|nr:isoaspartyl peptidase/L-asparaginase [Candidatus Thermoplasmatota archaeon]